MSLREKVEFAANMPTQVVLDGIGALQEGRNGPEYRYFLRDEKIMWVPPEVHGALEQARANTGTVAVITKQQAKRGAEIRWKVETNGPAYAAPPSAQPARQPQPAAQIAASAPEELPVTHADIMAQCLKDAIDLLRGAKSYAPEIAWDTQDVRALAATLFIAQTQGGRK